MPMQIYLYIKTEERNTDLSAQRRPYRWASSSAEEELCSMTKSHNALAIRQESLITACWGLAYHQQQFLCGKYSHYSL